MAFQGRLPFIYCLGWPTRLHARMAVPWVSMPLLAWAGLVAGLPGGLAWLPHRLPPASTHASTRGLASSMNSSLWASDQADGLFLVTHCLALKT